MAQPSAQNPYVVNRQFKDAVINGEVNAIAKALDAGADINAPVDDRETGALFHAVLKKRHDVAKLLLERGIKRYPDESNASPPLLHAVSNDDTEMVRLLLDNGTDPNWMPEGWKKGERPKNAPLTRMHAPALNPIHRACIGGKEEMVKLMIKHGVDVDSCAYGGGSPLWYAAANSNYSTACLLLNAGANPDARYSSTRKRSEVRKPEDLPPPMTPDEEYISRPEVLFGTALRNNAKMLRMLLDAGADVEMRNERGQTPAEYLASQTSRMTQAAASVLAAYEAHPKFDAAKLQDMRKADLFATNEAGYCLLDSPGTWRHFGEITQHLQKQGEALTAADLEKRNKDGITWLQRGVECFATAEVFGYYQQKTGDLPIKAMIAGGQEGAPLLRALCDRKQITALFSREVWQNKSRDDLMSVYKAMPEQHKGEVGNYYQLLASIPHTQATRGR